MSLTSYRAAPPRDSQSEPPPVAGGRGDEGEERVGGLAGLAATYSSAAGCGSTMGAEGFHGRVRDGIGCLAPRYGHQACPRNAPAAVLAKGKRAGGCPGAFVM